MRLLHTKTLKLHEFFGTSIPPYIILSHTWGEGEVSFQELQSGSGESKAGYDKIRGCCKIAASDGFEYAWVDTCCIDKTSSAELSEAINSMYSCYRLSDICYVYLADVLPDLGAKARDEAIRKSRWFTRGWTLQELIAPSSVIFYDSCWHELGTKDTLETLISDITKIDGAVLRDADEIESFSVAQRMSWASMRVTTRVEDVAYCLLGIFSVHMPMLYGEGDHAFVRLQEEIMRTTADHSIFAWATETWTMERSLPGFRQGLLALTPAWFQRSGNIVCTPSQALAIGPFSVTNKGIHLYLPMRNTRTSGTYLAVLNCHKNGETMTQLGIYLERRSEGSDIFERRPTDSLGEVERVAIPNLDQQNIFVKQGRRPIRVPSHDRFAVSMAGLRNSVFAFKGVTP
ncbi:HET domain containing protein, partial [Hyaloscypha variabilis]